MQKETDELLMSAIGATMEDLSVWIDLKLAWGPLGFSSVEACETLAIGVLEYGLEWEGEIGEQGSIAVSFDGFKRLCLDPWATKGWSWSKICVEQETILRSTQALDAISSGRLKIEKMIPALIEDALKSKASAQRFEIQVQRSEAAKPEEKPKKAKKAKKEDKKPVRKMIRPTATPEQVARAMARAEVLAEETDREILGSFEILRVGSKR
jgi:hypothetical protein